MKQFQNSSSEDIPMVANEVEINTTELEDFNNISISDTKPPQPKSTISSPLFAQSEYYNGAVYDSYCWSQTDSEIEINIIIPEHIKSTKDIKLNLTSSKLLITDRTPESSVLFEGEFKESCRADSLLWSFSNRKIQISLGKYDEYTSRNNKKFLP